MSGYVLYRDMCRTGMLAALGHVLYRDVCGAVLVWCCTVSGEKCRFVPGRLETCFVHF